MVKIYSTLLEPTSEDDCQGLFKALRGATPGFSDCEILEKGVKAILNLMHRFTSYFLSHAPKISVHSHPTSLSLNSGCSSQIDLSASVARCQSTSVPRRDVRAGERGMDRKS